MTCTKCLEKAVENQALNKKFWYCRTCKTEVLEDAEESLMRNWPSPAWTDQELDDFAAWCQATPALPDDTF